MGKEYLTEAAEFSCPLGMRYKAKETVNQKAKHNGSKLLTSAAILFPMQPPILCAKLPPLPSGTPSPCPCAVSPLTGAIKHKATANLLTTDSKAQCLAGQSITVSKSGVDNKIIHTDSNISITALDPIAIEAIKELKPDKQEKPKISAPNVYNKKSAEDSKQDEKEVSNALLATSAVEKDKEQLKAPFIPRTGMLCPVNEKSEKCADCEYRLDRRTSPVVANDSKTLRDNYINAQNLHDKYDCYVDDLFGLYGNVDAYGVKMGWSTAAHHIISGKQVLEEFPLLIKLARFCGYDVDNDKTKEHGINHYPNCIMLVGYPSDYGKIGDGEEPLNKKEKDFLKSANADEVMRDSLIQWHVGSHQYRFAKNEKQMLRKNQREKQEYNAAGSVFHKNMQTYLGKRKEFQGQDLKIACYADLVKARLQEFQDELKNNPVCYRDNEQAKQDFIYGMESISKEIKAKLAAFKEKPHRSYPYFVSLEAYLYAFAVPRTTYIALMRRYRQGFSISNWRVTRYADTEQDTMKSLSFDSVGEKMILHKLKTDGSSDEEVLNSLKSVSKTCYFLITDDIKPEELHFLKDADSKEGTAYFFKLRETEKSDAEILQANDSEISTWLRQVAKKFNEREDLSGAVGVTKKRLEVWNEYKGGDNN